MDYSGKYFSLVCMYIFISIAFLSEGGRHPPIMSLPHSVLSRLAGILDGAAVHNWRTLIEHLPEYTQTDAIQFATEEQQVYLNLCSQWNIYSYLPRVVVQVWQYLPTWTVVVGQLWI